MRTECKEKPYEFQPLGNRAVVAVMRTLPPCDHVGVGIGQIRFLSRRPGHLAVSGELIR